MHRLMTPLLLVLSLLFGAATFPAKAADEWTVRESARSVSETVSRLTAAIERSGGQITAVVDHSAAGERVGVAIAPTMLVIFSNPRIGIPAIEATPRLALDLPLRILVWEEEGVTRLGYPTTATLARRYDLALDDPGLRRMEEGIGSLVTAVLARGAEIGAR